jgi:NitT/TauT family transport system substrate-binding protein
MQPTRWSLGLLLVVLGVAAASCAPAPAAKPAAAPAPASGAGAPSAAKPATNPAPPATAAAAPAAKPAAPVPVRIASQFASTDVGHYLALERGYYTEAGLAVEMVSFANASEMIPALATDQVEVGGIGGNPAMWNAVARGVRLKLLLDKGSARPGTGNTALVVRKDVYDGGRGQRLDDLRGLRIAFTPPGKATTNAMPMDVGMQRVGASIEDFSIEPLPFPDMVPALANGSVDGAVIVEPFLSRVVRQGSAVPVATLDEMYPNFTIGVVGVSRALYGDRPTAKGLARAYVRAVRDYNNAVAGRTGAADRAQVDEILARHTRIDVAVVREMAPVGLNPNGRFNADSLRHAYQWFRERGFIPEPVSDATMDELWGLELVEEALGELGTVPES